MSTTALQTNTLSNKLLGGVRLMFEFQHLNAVQADEYLRKVRL